MKLRSIFIWQQRVWLFSVIGDVWGLTDWQKSVSSCIAFVGKSKCRNKNLHFESLRASFRKVRSFVNPENFVINRQSLILTFSSMNKRQSKSDVKFFQIQGNTHFDFNVTIKAENSNSLLHLLRSIFRLLSEFASCRSLWTKTCNLGCHYFQCNFIDGHWICGNLYRTCCSHVTFDWSV